MQSASQKNNGATIFAYPVSDPERYGVVSFNEKGMANSIEEKPEKPKSNFAVPGMYFYDNNVVSMAENLKPFQEVKLKLPISIKNTWKVTSYLSSYLAVVSPG